MGGPHIRGKNPGTRHVVETPMVAIELRPGQTDLTSTTVTYPHNVILITPWKQLLTAHYRSIMHRPGIDYNQLRRGEPTGREWLCVGKVRPPKSYDQGPKTLKPLFASSTQQWDLGTDWTNKMVTLTRKQWDRLGLCSVY